MNLYNDELWEGFVEKVEEDFKLKTYPHFDPYFHFPTNKEEVRALISGTSPLKSHNFLPFVKTINKTPRYRWQENEKEDAGGHYSLETKPRPISFASHFDTYIYGYYAYALNHYYQKYIRRKEFHESVLAYRTDLKGPGEKSGKCNIQFAKEAFDRVDEMVKKHGECSVICLDIKGYFDNINHNTLKEAWCKIINEDDLPYDQFKVFKSLTQYSYVNLSSFLKHFDICLKRIERRQRKKYPNKKSIPRGYSSLFDLVPNSIKGPSFNDKMNLLRERNLVNKNHKFTGTKSRKRVAKKKGIPQGSAMSAVLSNIYLTDFDKEINEKGKEEGFVYRRYCDDLLIICPTHRVNALNQYLKNLIDQKYELEIQDKKTNVVDMKEWENGIIRSFRRGYNAKDEMFESIDAIEENFSNLQYLGFDYNGQNIYIRPSSVSRYFRKMKARIVRSVIMAYNNGNKIDKIFRKQMFRRYTHFGNRNFYTYALNASKEYYVNSHGERKEGMGSPSIKKQLSNHMEILNREVEKTSQQIAKKEDATKIKK